jgi:hypothetical protein
MATPIFVNRLTAREASMVLPKDHQGLFRACYRPNRRDPDSTQINALIEKGILEDGEILRFELGSWPDVTPSGINDGLRDGESSRMVFGFAYFRREPE